MKDTQMMNQWTRDLMRVASTIMSTGKVPLAYSTAKRTVGYACCPICCGICCVWSSFMRVIACPSMFIFKGPQYACSNNCCTRITDDSIGAYIGDISRCVVIRTMPSIERASKQDIADLISAIETLQGYLSGNVFNTAHYMLVDVVVKPVVSSFRLILKDVTVRDLIPSSAPSILRDIIDILGKLHDR